MLGPKASRQIRGILTVAPKDHTHTHTHSPKTIRGRGILPMTAEYITLAGANLRGNLLNIMELGAPKTGGGHAIFWEGVGSFPGKEKSREREKKAWRRCRLTEREREISRLME